MIGPIAKLRFRREHRWTYGHLSSYIDQELGDSERRRIEAHTSICPECHRLLATLRETVTRLRGIGQTASDAPTTPAGGSIAESVIDALRRGG